MNESLQPTPYNIWQHVQGLHVGYLWFGGETLLWEFTEQELEHWDLWLVRGNC